MRRMLAALGLSAALLLGGCQYPDGSVNWGNTLLLGAGVGAAAALVAGAASDNHPHRHYAGDYGRGYRAPYNHGYGNGYGYAPYRGW